MPGEKVEDKLRVTLHREQDHAVLEDQVLQGTFESEADSAMTSITITVTVVNGRVPKRVYLGQYSGKGDTFDFRFAPTEDASHRRRDRS